MRAISCRSSRGVCSALLSVLLLLVTAPGATQVRSASRHDLQDRMDVRDASRERIASLYDADEMTHAMELGAGSLRGTMGVIDKQGIEGLLGRLLKGKSVALADREWVTLLPMTPHVEAWFNANNEAERRMGEAAVGGLNPEVWQYAGRTRTDSRGNFQFDGLKPGRYLILSHFPVEYSAHRTYETGEYAVEFSYSPMFGAGSGSIRPVTRTERYQSTMYVWVSEVVEVKSRVVTSFAPPTKDLL